MTHRKLIEQMLEAMEVWSDARLSAQGQKAITAARSWLAAPEQSPVVGTKTWFENGKLIVQDLTAADVYKEPEQSEPVAFRCNFDGYGWDYRDNGSGSNWKAFPYKDKEFLYTHPAPSLREPEQSEPDWKKPPEYVPPLVKWAQEQTALPLRELSDADKAVEAALNNLLYWTERAVDKGNANSDIEEAMEQYNEALAAARSKT